MQSSRDEVSKQLDHTEPLSETEIDELATALHRLSTDGIAVPKHLLRHAFAGDIRTMRHYGYTHDAIPAALDRLGADREQVVVGLIRRFEQVVRQNRDQVKNREKGAPLDKSIWVRYFDLTYLVGSAKPKTEKSVNQVADFLLSDESEAHEKASEMLRGAPYFPIIVDRIFENVATYGIRQWPNRQSHALASFANVPEVRLRLMDAFHSPQENLRHLAVMTFPLLREGAGQDAELEMFAIAENDKDKLQAGAVDGLRAITPGSARLRSLALRLVHSDMYWVRGQAILCLEAFQDRESIDALLSALLDEGGHDFDNAGWAAKALQKMPLDADHVLEPLMATMKRLLEREDKVYEEHSGFRSDVQKLADAFKFMAEQRGEATEGLGTISYASPETLLAVARIFSRLGPAARPAIHLIEDCAKRPYIAGAGDEGEWQDILKAIEKH